MSLLKRLFRPKLNDLIYERNLDKLFDIVLSNDEIEFRYAALKAIESVLDLLDPDTKRRKEITIKALIINLKDRDLKEDAEGIAFRHFPVDNIPGSTGPQYLLHTYASPATNSVSSTSSPMPMAEFTSAAEKPMSTAEPFLTLGPILASEPISSPVSISPPATIPTAVSRSVSQFSPQPINANQTGFSRWKSVYIFISSTFNDMHAERDYLVKQVFPELREWCEQRKLHLVDIDLRWGVTEQDATQNRRVVQVCMERIDQCRPFFLCFLGQRRGWVPRNEDVLEYTLDEFPGLKDYIGMTSVTEMEILHALINPMRRTKKEEQVKYAFFYLRDPSYLADIPAEPNQLKEIYTNENISDLTERATADRELAEWRESKIPVARSTHHYQAVWDPRSVTPEVALPLICSSSSTVNVALWRAQWHRAGVTAVLNDIPETSGELEKALQFNSRLTTGRLVNFECDHKPLRLIILDELKQAIASEFGDHMQLAQDSPLQREIDQQEQFFQAASEGFIARQGDFEGLDAYIQGSSNQIYVLTAPGGMGKSTLLVNWINQLRTPDALSKASVFFRFIGASDGSTSVDSLLPSLLKEIQGASRKITSEIPADPKKLREQFLKLLEEIGRSGKTILVLDALNQLEGGLMDLGWLPWQLPAGIKLIVSFKRGSKEGEDLYGQWKEAGQALLGEVQPFDSLDDRRKLVQAYLSQYLKELDEDLLDDLIRLPGAENPLYLKVVLSELRVYGIFGELKEKIRKDFGETPLSAFESVLRRLETDPTYTNITPAQAVPIVFGLLAHARNGLAVDELVEILMNDLGLEPSVNQRQQVGNAVHLFLRQVRPFMARREGRYDFFYESFKLAALQRYSGVVRSKEDWHGLLADYFNKLDTWQDIQHKVPTSRKISELPFHLAMAHRGGQTKQILADFDFLEAKITAGQIDSLNQDFERVGAGGLKLHPPFRTAYAFQGKLWNICPFCWAESLVPEQLLGKETACTACGNSMKLNLFTVQRAWKNIPVLQMKAGHYSRQGLILDDPDLDQISDFIRNQAFILRVYPSIFLQQALDQPEFTFLHQNASKIIKEKSLPHVNWLTKSWPPFASACVKTMHRGGNSGTSATCISSDGGSIYNVAENQLFMDDLRTHVTNSLIRFPPNQGGIDCTLSADGKFLAIASSQKKIRVYSTNPLREIKEMEGFSGMVNTCALSSDGSLLLAGGADGTLKLWNIAEEKLLLTVSTFNGAGVITCAFSPDGKTFTAGTNRLTRTLEANIYDPDAPCFQVMETASGNCLFKLEGKTKDGPEPHYQSYQHVNHCAYSPDGTVIAVAIHSYKSHREYLYGFRTDTFEVVFKQEYIYSINHFSFSPDGKWMALSHGGKMSILRLDPFTESAIFWSQGLLKNQIHFSADGEFLVTTNADNTLRIWDIKLLKGSEQTSVEKNLLQDNMGIIVESCAFSPDQHNVVVGSDMGTSHYYSAWDIASGSKLIESASTTNVAGKIFFSPGNDFFGVAKFKNITLFCYPSMTIYKRLQPKDGKKEEIVAISFTPDGSKLLVCYLHGMIDLWDVQSGMQVYSVENSNRITSAAISPDGYYFVVWAGDLDFYELSTGKKIKQIPLSAGSVSPGSKCYFSPDGIHLALSGYHSGSVKLNDLTIQKAHSGRNLKYSPQGDVMLTETQAFSDIYQVIDCHDLSKKRMEKAGVIIWAEFSPDGKYLIVILRERKIATFYSICQVWEVDTGQVLARFPVNYYNDEQIDISSSLPYMAASGKGSTWYLLKFMNIPWGLPYATAVYAYQSQTGQYDRLPSVICKWCGSRYSLDEKMTARLVSLAAQAESGSRDGQDDLLSECPVCHQLMHINPFLIDSRNFSWLWKPE